MQALSVISHIPMWSLVSVIDDICSIVAIKWKTYRGWKRSWLVIIICVLPIIPVISYRYAHMHILTKYDISPKNWMFAYKSICQYFAALNMFVFFLKRVGLAILALMVLNHCYGINNSRLWLLMLKLLPSSGLHLPCYWLYTTSRALFPKYVLTNMSVGSMGHLRNIYDISLYRGMARYLYFYHGC